MEKITHVDCILSDDITIMTSSLRKVVYMFRIKFPTKRIFRIFLIVRTDGMAQLGTYLWNDPRILGYSGYSLGFLGRRRQRTVGLFAATFLAI